MSNRLFANLLGGTLDAAKKERTLDKETLEKRKVIRERTLKREAEAVPSNSTPYSPPPLESHNLAGFPKTKTEPILYYLPKKSKDVAMDIVSKEEGEEVEVKLEPIEDTEMKDVIDDVKEVIVKEESGGQEVNR